MCSLNVQDPKSRVLCAITSTPRGTHDTYCDVARTSLSLSLCIHIHVYIYTYLFFLHICTHTDILHMYIYIHIHPICRYLYMYGHTYMYIHIYMCHNPKPVLRGTRRRDSPAEPSAPPRKTSTPVPQGGCAFLSISQKFLKLGGLNSNWLIRAGTK